MDAFLIFTILFLFIMLFAIGAIVAAALVMSKNKQTQNAEPEQYVRAEVIRTDATTRKIATAGRKYSYDHTQYFVIFRDDYNKEIQLNCSKSIYETLITGFYGDLVYKGTKLISFVRLNEHEEQRIQTKLEEGYFFEKSTPKTNPIEFYCDAPGLGVKIPSDSPILLDDDEVIRYVNSMLENKQQNFFGLDNKLQIIQFFNEGDNDEILIDIPDVIKNGSYQAIIKGINKTKSIVRAYYRGEDVFDLADFEFMQF